MIKRPTVFVLGAGASRHLDYPTSEELRRQIIQLTVNPDMKEWATHSFTQDEVKNFGYRFQSSVPSIDAFLELHQKFDRLGKTAIARALIPFESDNSLWKHTLPHAQKHGWTNWYEYLFTLLRSGVKKPDDFWLNQFSVITFNYDRSLEHYLARCLDSAYGIKYVEAVRLLSERIFHVHGVLSPLGMSDGERQYSSAFDAKVIGNAAESIKVVHESQGDGAYKRAHEMLSTAARVYFLGFGYDRANLAKLNWPAVSTAQIYGKGTCFGMEPGEVAAIRERYRIEFDNAFSYRGIEPFLRNMLPASVDH